MPTNNTPVPHDERFEQKLNEYVEAFESELDVRDDVDMANWPKVNDSTVRVRKDSAQTVERVEVAGSGAGGTVRDVGDARQLPVAGETFSDFELLCELGRGAFARVFLARQSELAGRSIVLKITQLATSEAQQLARLQHTNIVPIHSVCSADGLYAICMPDFGPCTLRDALKAIRLNDAALPSTGQVFADAVHARRNDIASVLHKSGYESARQSNEISIRPPTAGFEEDGYVDACIRIALQVGQALRHAHRQNVVHCDLKPANVLLATHGQVMLLDFNLSDERAQELCRRSIVSGTLPYAAPEHLRALLTGDRIGFKSDIFSLGVILYELLTGKLPFPPRPGASEVTICEMIADRGEEHRSTRSLNRSVSPSLSALVDRMLAAKPNERYANMSDVCEDLQRHLEHRPLKHVANRSVREYLSKWSECHPGLSSAAVLSTVAGCVVFALMTLMFVHSRHRRVMEFSAGLDEIENQMPLLRAYTSLPNSDPSMLKRGLRIGETSMSNLSAFLKVEHGPRYQFPPLPAQQAKHATILVSDCLYFMANASLRLAVDSQTEDLRAEYASNAAEYNRLARTATGVARGSDSLRRQAIEIDRIRDGAAALNIELPAPAGRDTNVTRAMHFIQQYQFERAIPLLEARRANEPFDLANWFLLGNCYMLTDRLHEAEGCFTTCAVMWSDDIPGCFHRGICRLQLETYHEAEQDFARILEIDAEFVPALINRAVARRAQNKIEAAREDLDRAIALNATQTRVFFMRSELRQQLGDPEGAKADFGEGIDRQPSDEQSFVRRGFALMCTFPERSIEDFKEAARLNPRSYAAHRNWAYVLGEHLSRPNEAIKVLDAMLQWDPDQVDELLSRGVMYARLGRRTEAVRDAEAAMEKRRDSWTLFQAACVYALTSNETEDDASVAINLVKEAVADDPKWIAVARHDADLAMLHGRRDFDALLANAKTGDEFE